MDCVKIDKCDIDNNKYNNIIDILVHCIIYQCTIKENINLHSQIFGLFDSLYIKPNIVKLLKMKILIKTNDILSNDLSHKMIPDCIETVRGPSAFFKYKNGIVRITTGKPYITHWGVLFNENDKKIEI
jgi:hypothetical protein